jgi:hypothetical protein
LSTPREESNTAEDFLEFVYSVIQAGALVAGDLFIVDNASIHFAMETMDELGEVFVVSYWQELCCKQPVFVSSSCPPTVQS